MNFKNLSIAVSVIIWFGTTISFAQETQENLRQSLRANSIDPNGGILFGKKLPPSGVDGNYYMFKERTLGDIEMSTGKIFAGQRLQYDLYKDELEVLVKNVVYVMPNVNVRSILLYENVERTFVNGLDYEFLGDSLAGFLEVLVEGKFTLLSSIVLKIKKPTYRPDTNLGNQNYVVSKQHELYLTKGNVLVKLVSDNKLNYKWFSEKENVVRYFKKNKLDLFNITDAIFAVQYYNAN